MDINKFKLILFEKKRDLLYNYGIRTGKIMPYEYELIKRLRNIYYGGIPASILLLIPNLCNGKCYDRSLLITMGMDDFQLVNGDTKDLELRYGKESANHSWAESNGWVYDTSLGYKIEKNLYYMIHTPVIKKINSKKDCYEYQEYQDILNSDIEKDKYILPLVFPLIEIHFDDSLYSTILKEEYASFKQKINYDSLCEEIQADMVAKGFRR